MYSFVAGILALILGYIVYGRIVSRVFGVDKNRPTPAITHRDNIDYVPMATWKVYLIQFLNIAGTGPIFGAILGILYGPSAYIWIVLGCLFGGAVHDYLAAMISLRQNGVSLPEIIGQQLGRDARVILRFFTLILMIMVGAAFTMTPAGLLAHLTPSWGVCGTVLFWTIIIFVYYVLAALLPINKIIGNIYPVFGFVLILMAIMVFVGIFTHTGYMPELSEAFANHHPHQEMPLFPGICITISCGAVSGFHATQSPLMARCLKKERMARPVFYGAMVTEGLIAMIWAGAAILFVSGLDVAGSTPYEKVLNYITENGQHTPNPTILINALCNSWFGGVGAALALLGVVFAPITTGDTALRSARLILADAFHVDQSKLLKRITILFPVFALSVGLTCVEFNVLWRYLAWINQTLAVFTLWAITVYLAKYKKAYIVSLIPAIWMTAVCATYILIAPEGFSVDATTSTIVGCAITLFCLMMFHRFIIKLKKKNEYTI